ncbi:hypothetical protein [Nocardioides convexus]|uniref:hypothetical protein n=1 Tax=Nocardioides convexus TaxID=2712224 RepID=UPI0024188837|nr:hypothetical protein [Nocardioides convexus]
MLRWLRSGIEANLDRHGILYPWWVPAVCTLGQPGRGGRLALGPGRTVAAGPAAALRAPGPGAAGRPVPHPCLAAVVDRHPRSGPRRRAPAHPTRRRGRGPRAGPARPRHRGDHRARRPARGPRRRGDRRGGDRGRDDRAGAHRRPGAHPRAWCSGSSSARCCCGRCGPWSPSARPANGPGTRRPRPSGSGSPGRSTTSSRTR